MTKAKRPLTNAERQARYRQRHIRDIDGQKRRLSLFLDMHARRQLERIARHKCYTVTALIEEWAAKAEQRITARMTMKEEKAYFSADVTQ
jgi:hypothetical protein